ncbi:MAG: tol-pal system protein YbgF [Thermodesulfobacteriota bacterium]|nr:tol-pal system protein YbgF [Thermodesulfobacteriota bacterium]
MKKTIVNLLLILCISPFLVQCIATKDDLKRVNFRIRTLDNRLGYIEKEVNELNRIAMSSARKDSVQKVQKQQARMGDTLDRLKTDLLQIKGHLEVSSHKFSKIHKKSKTLQSKLTTQLDQITAKTDLIADQLDKTSVEVEEIKITKAREAAEQARQAAKAAEEARARAARSGGPRKIEPTSMKKKWVKDKKSTTTATTARKTPSRALYDKAYSAFKAKRYKEAHSLFTKYAAEYPNGQMLPNARFWLGDCLFNQNEYELSILEYQKVIADFPNHAKAPAGLLKQGLAFEKLKDYETSEIVYRKLLKEYPKSEQAITAKKWLKNR